MLFTILCPNTLPLCHSYFPLAQSASKLFKWQHIIQSYGDPIITLITLCY